MNHSDTQCLSRREAAAALGIGLSSLKALLSRGDIRQVRIGRRSIVPRGEITRYITERLNAGGPQ